MKDEWWYAIDQTRLGPVSLDALRKMRSEGILSESSLVWREGMPAWLPLSEVPDLKQFPSAHHNLLSPSSTRRAIARLIDWYAMTLLISFPIGFALGLLNPGFALWIQDLGSQMLFGWLVLTPLAFVAEAMVFGLFGTTLGKALFSITVTTVDGHRPTFSQYNQRQFDVYCAAGSCVPFLYLFFVMVWERQIRRTGQASYDENRFAVTAPKLGFLRGVATAAVLFALVLIVAATKQLGYSSAHRWTNEVTGKSVAVPSGWLYKQETAEGRSFHSFIHSASGSEVIFAKETVDSSIPLSTYVEFFAAAVKPAIHLVLPGQQTHIAGSPVMSITGNMVADQTQRVHAFFVYKDSRVWRAILTGPPGKDPTTPEAMKLRDLLFASLD